MDFGLEGRVALVTGASKGLGRGIAAALAAEGARVALASRSADRAAAAAEETGAAASFAHDTGDVAAAPGLVQRVEAELGPLEILVRTRAARRRAPTPWPSRTSNGRTPIACSSSARWR